MRAVMVMFDSLNRRYLPPYGNDRIDLPNFSRLAAHAATFDAAFVGSLPCMPARRDIHTGRLSFLHRSWGPLEPFDNSMPELLKEHGIHSRLVSDHYHYWEDGGATYHSRYASWDCIRGQEGDTWVGDAGEAQIPDHVPTMREFTHPEWWENSWKNRARIEETGLWPQDLTFDSGLEFLNRNHDRDNWFLHLETFDPHEPFTAPEDLPSSRPDTYDGPLFDWPPYAPADEAPEVIEHARRRYEALLAMCDRNLGRVLDAFDRHDLWKDTLLIVNTDHGFMLGEKGWWAKSVMPCYQELANIPFFVWDPRCGVQGQRRKSLVQTIDIAPTILDWFGLAIPPEMRGKPLAATVAADTPVREAALFGFHGSFVNVTDGRHVLMKAAANFGNEPLNEYTLMPTHQQGFFKPHELRNISIVGPLPFSRGCEIMKIPSASRLKNVTFCNSFHYGDLLWDLQADPNQEHPIRDEALRARLILQMTSLMRDNDADADQYRRLGLDPETAAPAGPGGAARNAEEAFAATEFARHYRWSGTSRRVFAGLLALAGSARLEEIKEALARLAEGEGAREVTPAMIERLIARYYSEDPDIRRYFIRKLEMER